MQGHYFRNKKTEKGWKRSIESFQKAVEKDPEFALAHTGLADCYLDLGWYGFLPRKDAYTRSKAEAIKALEIDDTLSEAHVSLGNIRIWLDWEWTNAEMEYKQALALNSSNAEARHMYSHLLSIIGRHKEAIQEMRQALELEPFSVIINSCLGQVLFLARRYDEAMEQLQKTVEMDSNFPPLYQWLGMTYLEKGILNQAIEKFQKGATFSEIQIMMIGYIGYTYAVIGKKSEARDRIEQLKYHSKKNYVDPYFIAQIYAGLGEKNDAFAWLNKAYNESSLYIILLKVDPLFDNLRGDSRLKELLKMMKLE